MIDATEAGNTYGLALLMMVSGAYSSFATNTTTCGGAPGTSSDVWWPEFNTARQLGAPLGAYTNTGGLYTRLFQFGNVACNTTSGPLGGVPAYTGQINYTG